MGNDAAQPHMPIRKLHMALPKHGARKGYAFTISIILLATTLIALAVFSSSWRRTQEQSSAVLALPSDGLRVEDRVAGDLGNLFGTKVEIRKNSSAAAVALKVSFPFKKEGLPLADLHTYAGFAPALINGKSPYELALAPNFAPISDPVALTIQNVGAVKVSNNGTSGTDAASYSFPPGLGPSSISISAFCSKVGRSSASTPPTSLTSPIGISISYNDSSGPAVSVATTVNSSSNTSFSVAFVDGTNISLRLNLSSTSQSNIAVSYTKSPGAAMVLTFDSNSTNATGGVSDYSPAGSNMTLGGGNSSKAPAWSSTGCHSYGCYLFDGVDDFINGSANFTGEASMIYSEATYGLNGAFESVNATTSLPYNWVPVGNSSAVTFTSSTVKHSGSRALGLQNNADGKDVGAFIYNRVAVGRNNSVYSLEFWARNFTGSGEVRYVVLDRGNNQYLSSNGSWQNFQTVFSSVGSSAYSKFVRNFRTSPSNVGTIQVQFHVPSGSNSLTLIDDVSLVQVSDFTFSFWGKTPATSGTAISQTGSAGRFGTTGVDFSFSGRNLTANLSSDGANLAQKVTVGDNFWHHLALSVNRTGNTSLFLDGSLVSTSNFSIGTLNSSPNFTIGARNQTAGFFAGTLDEIRIYRRALSASEIRGHYYNRYQSPCSLNITVVYSNASPVNISTTAYYNANLAVRSLVPGAVLYSSFDGNITSNLSGAVLDYSGYANAGTLGGGNSSKMPAWTANGKSSGAYAFNGNLSYVEVPFSQSINLTRTMTLMAWFFMASQVNASHATAIFSKGSGTNNNGQYELLICTDGRPCFRGTAQNANVSFACNTNVNSSLNTWHFVATTFNGTTVNCYADGYSDGSTTNSGWTMPLVSTDDPLTIGTRFVNRNAQGYSHLNGTIDEVRIYNRVLSAEEIDSIYKDTILIRKGPIIASAD